MILNCLARSIPILFLPLPVGLRRHDACHGVGEPLIHRAMRLLAGTQASEPVSHMVEREVINTHRGKLGFAWKENKLRGPLLVDTWIVFMVALLLDHAIAWAA